MADYKPNHICKNPKCTKGKHGGRKEYYACNYCDRVLNWKSVACSEECFEEYQNAVIEARINGKSISLLPERTDMCDKEVNELLNKPIETVLKEMKEELKEFTDIDGNIDFVKSVNKINESIDKKNTEKNK